MTVADALERPVLSFLSGPGAGITLRQAGALRLDPDFGLFAALEDAGPESLEAMAGHVRTSGPALFMQPDVPPPVPGTRVATQAAGVQMVGEEAPARPPPAFEIIPLTDADAPQMLALATLTRPGPFARRTHELGGFVGVKEDGRLVAMAGERMRMPGFAEVSGVCTHPDRRGRGYAAGLMRHVAEKIRARGETPFLHAYASNTGAIGLYESLGYRTRRQVLVTVLEPA
ncbi:GNAT family N-acetyltransferase [Phenylobacterium sp.]|jgi:predicted GNAT family acetyltransferase|uniref:GNAT family N-acetyltransferase n=1 Tax=Phenylobacterium sp. TaxID=1871053 RepID=UPI002F93CCED